MQIMIADATVRCQHVSCCRIIAQAQQQTLLQNDHECLMQILVVHASSSCRARKWNIEEILILNKISMHIHFVIRNVITQY